jgi:hypothetical protein
MDAQLATTVYVQDPDTHQTVELAPGSCPEARLAALVTNPAAWIDGRLPTTASHYGPGAPETPDDSDATGDGGKEPAADAEPGPAAEDEEQAAPAAEKPAAKKTATPSRGGRKTAAAEGSGRGQ